MLKLRNLFIFVVLTSLLISCGAEEPYNKIMGKWNHDFEEGDYIKITKDSFTLYDNGTTIKMSYEVISFDETGVEILTETVEGFKVKRRLKYTKGPEGQDALDEYIPSHGVFDTWVK